MTALKCLFAAAASSVATAEAFTLIDAGDNLTSTIVIRADAGECERYAAEELRDYLEKSTGVRLTVETDASALPERAIVIGETSRTAEALGADDVAARTAALGSDGFRLVANGTRLVVLGSAKRGVLYGVYELLEKYAGCRWYASWHTVVPKRDKVTVPDDLDVTETPSFEMREPYWYDVIKHRDFAARLRVNGQNTGDAGVEKYGGEDYRFGGGLNSSHTFDILLPPDEFYAEHPEYFSLVDGKRRKYDGQPCLTNPDVLKIVTERVLERIRKDPGKKFYGVSQNDRYNYCECDACKAVDEEEESHAGTLVRFVNSVAEAVEKEFPDVIIETLAYQYTRKPPKLTRLRSNVMPCLCTIECDFALPIDESAFSADVSFKDDITGWDAQTDSLYLWDYVTDFHNYHTPFADVKSLKENLRFFKSHGVKYMFEQGDYEGAHADFAELKAWLLSKWMWNVELDEETLLADFFNGYYGAGASQVRAYFDELHSLQAEYSRSGEHPLTIYDGVDNPALDDDFLERAFELWREAMAATKDDAATHYNVRMGAYSVAYMIFERLRLKYDRQAWFRKPPAEAEADFVKAKKFGSWLLKVFDEEGDMRLREYTSYHLKQLARWRNFVAKESIPTVRRCTIQESELSGTRQGEWCDFVDDPEASDGRALKYYNTHHEWCSDMYLNLMEFNPNTRYILRVRVRVEAQGDGEAFWAGIYDPVNKEEVLQTGWSTEETSSDYRWYTVGEWTPREGEYFWLGPGRFEDGGTSAVKAVWLDKIEIIEVSHVTYFETVPADYDDWPADGAVKAVAREGAWTATWFAELVKGDSLEAFSNANLVFAPNLVKSFAENPVEAIAVVTPVPHEELPEIDQTMKGAITVLSDESGSGVYYGLVRDADGGASNIWTRLTGAVAVPGESVELAIALRASETGCEVRYRAGDAVLSSSVSIDCALTAADGSDGEAIADDPGWAALMIGTADQSLAALGFKGASLIERISGTVETVVPPPFTLRLR